MTDREAAIARCRREMAEAERLLRAGHPDTQGLVMALADWACEARLLAALAAEGAEGKQ